MNCVNEDICSVRATHIDNEIDCSLKNIQSQREHAVNGAKIYLTVLFGLLGYFGFLNTKIIKTLSLPDEKYQFFAIFGVAIILVTFISGWILLDYITNIMFSTIVQYKHISYMRYLKSLNFTDIFSKNCIYPLAAKSIQLRRSRHLPIVFCFINFLLLVVIFYSLSLGFSKEISITYTLMVLGIFAVYFPNVCIKYYEETSIAQFINPKRDEQNVRNVLINNVKRTKKRRYYRMMHLILTISLIIFFFSTAINLFSIHVYETSVPHNIIKLQLLALALLSLFRYLMVQYRINKGCLRDSKT